MHAFRDTLLSINEKKGIQPGRFWLNIQQSKTAGELSKPYAISLN